MLLETEKLNKTYYTGQVEVRALREIDLSITEGEFTSIVGPSGSGKTTLLNCLGCIDRPTDGRVVLRGEEITGMDSDSQALLRREHFGFIFQTYNLIPVLTVFENVELPLKLLKKFTPVEINEKVLSILHRVGLKGLEERMPGELSGGQQQRVSIARALVKNPDIIFADEPTANLDSTTGEAIISLMKEMNLNEGTTFLFSTHDPLVMKHAGRIVEIKDGQIDGGSK